MTVEMHAKHSRLFYKMGRQDCLCADTLAAGHFMGNINNSAFTLMSTNGLINLNINQGCVLSYKASTLY